MLTGGTFRTLRSALAEATIAQAWQNAPHCAPTLPPVMPVGGAALRALDAAGVAVVEGHISACAQGHGWHPEETFV